MSGQRRRRVMRQARPGRQRIPAAVPAPPTPAPQFSVVKLQSLVGNQAAQRLLQRDVPITAPPPLPRLDPAAGLRAEMARTQPVYDYLNENRVSIMLSPELFSIVQRIRRAVPQAIDIPTGELQTIIRSWARDNRIGITEPPPRERVTAGAVENAAQSGLSLSASGQVGRDAEGRVSLSFSGATAELTRRAGTEGASVTVAPGGVSAETRGGGVRMGASVGWSGNVGFNISRGDLRFSASMDESRWQFQLQYGDEQAPDLSAISEVFRTGEAALRRAIRGITSASGPEDIQAAVSENLGAVKSAVSTASDLGSLQAGHFSASLQISGPGPGADRRDPAAGAVTFSAVLTFVF